MRRAPYALAALLLGSVSATTAPTLTLAQQAQRAQVIVRATLGTPLQVTEEGVGYTVVPLKVTETLAGDAAQLPQNQGGPALYFLSGAEGLPTFQAGQDAMLLLYTGRLDSPLVGYNQGVYVQVNGQLTSGTLKTMDALRSAIVAARGQR
ncbi:hypothetical protein [Deinococcus sonorensis]|uniref:Cyclophilin-like domain-containing protein n=2 Tax=Deinococcus sonorensis TaxID=309891 RepID=A0AAU7UAE3_9DEIO